MVCALKKFRPLQVTDLFAVFMFLKALMIALQVSSYLIEIVKVR